MNSLSFTTFTTDTLISTNMHMSKYTVYYKEVVMHYTSETLYCEYFVHTDNTECVHEQIENILNQTHLGCFCVTETRIVLFISKL